MSKENTVKFILDPNAPPSLTDEQQRRLEKAPESDGLSPENLDRLKPIPDVAQIRKSLHLSQKQFARHFKIPVATLRDWEQHRREPDAASRAYLTVIQKDSKAVEKALAS